MAEEVARKIITLDCREMEPPEPMVAVLEAVHKLAHNEALLMVHRKKPRLLLPRLDELNFKYRLTETGDDGVELLIWREA